MTTLTTLLILTSLLVSFTQANWLFDINNPDGLSHTVSPDNTNPHFNPDTVQVDGHELLTVGPRAAGTGTTWGFGIYRHLFDTQVHLGDIGYEGGPVMPVTISLNGDDTVRFLLTWGSRTVDYDMHFCTETLTADDSDEAPTFDPISSEFGAVDSLDLYVYVPNKAGRTYPDFSANGGGAGCEPTVTLVDSTSCSALFKLNYNWQTLVDTCGGFSTETVGDITTYTGSVTTAYNDTVTDSRGNSYTRSSAHTLSFSILLDTVTTVAATADTVVFSTINAEAIITEIIASSEGSSLTFVTAVQYPYQLDLASTGATVGPTTTELSLDSTFEAAEELGITVQTWTLTWTEDPLPCVLDGSYDVSPNFGVSCIVGEPCPADAESQTVNIEIVLDTDNLCSQVTETVEVSLTLDSYSDSSFTNPETNFLQSSTAFFEALVSSSDITVESFEITTVIVDVDNTAGTSSTTLYLSSANTPEGDDVSLVVSTTSFSVDLNSEFFANIDEIVDLSFSVTVVITYDNTVLKRTILDTKFMSKKVTKDIQLQINTEETASSSHLIITLIMICLSWL